MKKGFKKLLQEISIQNNLIYFIKWGVLSCIIGIVVGLVGVSFAYLINLATWFWQNHSFALFLLPLFGLVIAGIYHFNHADTPRGTNWVIDSISSGEQLPLRMAPVIYISSVLTHLGGGSSGREGAALQIGGSIGNFIAQVTGLGQNRFSDSSDKNIAVMCGMAACFSAVFGTPISATIFSMEVFSIGVMYHAALIPCLFSAYIAEGVASALKLPPERFIVSSIPAWSVRSVLLMIALGAATALAAILFAVCMKKSSQLYKKAFPNPFLRIIAAAGIFILLTLLTGTKEYNGGGFWLIEESMQGTVRNEAFLMKILFTSVILGGGFKGGEIVPTFVIGATLGGAFARLTGLDYSLCTACGMVGAFVGVTNCPIASIFMGIELCGSMGIHYYVIVVAVSFVLSGYYGLYSSQKFAYSKTEARYVGSKAADIRVRRRQS